jgi:minimal PKS acyl carrier protein
VTNSDVTYEELASLMKSRAGMTVEAEELAGAPDSPFEDFGLDSLGLLGVMSELEQRHDILIDDWAETCKTPNALLKVVNNQLSSGA